LHEDDALRAKEVACWCAGCIEHLLASGAQITYQPSDPPVARSDVQ